MSGITTAGVPICTLPSGGAPFPPGNVPQIGGYSALNTGEAETVVGDFAFTRSGANQYTATVTKLNGVTVGALATLNVGTGLTSSGGNLNLTTPVSIANGGLGTSTAPTTGMIITAQSASAYGPVSLSGDATITSAGALTVTKTNGVAFTGLATAAIPLSIANGGRGSSTAPSIGQIDVASSTTAFTPVTMSGDATITSAGAITVTKLNGVSPGPLFAATTPLSIANGGRGSATAPTAGQIDVAQSGTAFGAVSMSGDATITSAGVVTNGGLKGTAVPTLASGYLQYTGAAFAWSTPAGGFVAGGDLSGSMTSQTVIGIRSTSVPALASGYLHYTGAAFAWDTPATGSFAPTTNPAGGANNYAAIASPTFTGGVTAPTLNLTGTAPALTFNGTAMGGSCGAGSFVNVISNAGVPTCGVNLASLYAPLTNPVGGANNYAPLASPTFTGTVTLPDASTITSAGYNNAKAIGIGNAASAVAGQVMNVTSNGNYPTAISILNNGSGTSSAAGYFVNNASHYGAMQISGLSGTGVGTGVADTLMITTNAANGLALSGPQLLFYGGSAPVIASFGDTGWKVPNSFGKRVTPSTTPYTISSNNDCGEAIDTAAASGNIEIVVATAFEPIPGCAYHLYSFGSNLIGITMSTSGGAHLFRSGGLGDVVNPTNYQVAGNHSATLTFIAHLVWIMDIN